MNREILEAFDIDQLETLAGKYEGRHDSASAAACREAINNRGPMQSAELFNSGKLYAHESPRDNSGRIITRYSGDPAAWMKHFMTPGRVGRIVSDHIKGEANALRMKGGK